MISRITLVLLVVLAALPDLIRGSYETQDTIVLERKSCADCGVGREAGLRHVFTTFKWLIV